jgi:hypothetical protein
VFRHFLEPAVKVLQRFMAKVGGAEQKGGWGKDEEGQAREVLLGEKAQYS